MKCNRCLKEFDKPNFIETPNITHYGKELCPFCGIQIRWVPKPINKDKRIKTSKYDIYDILKFHNYNKIFCFFCLREQEQLGKRQTFQLDHIIELDKGGIDEIQNIQILCTACHKLKNWSRLYHNWHYED